MSLALFKRKIIVTAETSNGDIELSSDLHVSFRATKTSMSAANKCELMIWNLSKTTRNSISEVDTLITIYAGYEEDVIDLQSPEQIVFVGSVTSSNIERGNADNVTTLMLSDGETQLRDTKISISYKEGVSVRTVLADVAEQMGFELLDYTEDNGEQYVNGFSYAGVARRCVDKLAKRLRGSTWSIQDNRLQILPKDGFNNDDPVIVNASNGMVGSPLRIDKIENRPNKNEKLSGWSVACRMRPSIRPGGRVKISSQEIEESVFGVWNVKHIGDNYEGTEFTTFAELIREEDA